ncbi:MAG: amidohydrolase family protein [Thermoproteota archaeon]|jgi:cytosine/adenosine deaminase-related metal-dependent hydrolase|nr:amidohydrolase family protein [Thermoproteota archaeon]
MENLHSKDEKEIKARFALLDDFEFHENISMVIEDGIIKKIERGKEGNFPSIIITPPFVNAHVHTGDSCFSDIGYDLTLEELVKPVTGLKHKMLEKIDKALLKETRIKWVKNLIRLGYSIIADFVEGGFKGASEATEKFHERYLILGRPSKLNIEDELKKLYYYADGLGIPDSFAYNEDEMRLMREIFKDKFIHIHVSETKGNHDNKDFWIALDNLNPDAFVHCTHLNLDEIRKIKELKKFIIICPRSNLWFNVGFPDVISLLKEEADVAIGTDNIGWVSPYIWREIETLMIRIRNLTRIDYTKQLIKWATINGYKLFNKKGGIIKEGYPADFLIVSNERIGLDKSYNKLLTFIKRIDSSSIIEIYINGNRIRF